MYKRQPNIPPTNCEPFNFVAKFLHLSIYSFISQVASAIAATFVVSHEKNPTIPDAIDAEYISTPAPLVQSSTLIVNC